MWQNAVPWNLLSAKGHLVQDWEPAVNWETHHTVISYIAPGTRNNILLIIERKVYPMNCSWKKYVFTRMRCNKRNKAEPISSQLHWIQSSGTETELKWLALTWLDRIWPHLTLVFNSTRQMLLVTEMDFVLASVLWQALFSSLCNSYIVSN